MASLHALLVDSTPESDADVEWSELLSGTDVRLSVASSAERALEMLQEAGERQHDLVVLGPGLDDPAEVAGRLRGSLAERHLVILTRGSKEELRRSLAAPARLLGVRWTLIDVESDQCGQRLRATLAATRDRVRLRTTLGRINTALSSQEPAELSTLHRYTTSQRFHGNLVRQSRDAVVATSPDGTVVAWNLAAEDLFGISRSEAIGRHVSEVGDESWAEMASSLPFDAVPSGHGDTVEELIDIRMDGRDLEVTVSIIEGDDSVADGIGLAVRDVTERKSLERELAEARRLKSLGVLAGGLAHVINNALTTVRGNAEYLLMGDSSRKEQAECLRDIRTSVDKASELCRQMIALGGREAYAPERVDLNELVSQHESALRGSLPRGVDLRLELADTLPWAHLDERHVLRILDNLVENAAEALDGGAGTILVTTSSGEWEPSHRRRAGEPTGDPEGPFLELSVKDDGVGMDAHTRTRALEPFFSTRSTGRGLGLPVVLGLARSHGGTVDIDSTPEVGTEVKVRFPASEARGAGDRPGGRGGGDA